MANQIRSVTEANSMQPYSQYIGKEIFEDGKKVAYINEIKIDMKQVGSDIAVDMVCGYTEKGVLVFEWIRSAVNIEYFI